MRTVNWASRRCGRGAGTVAGGRVALAIFADLLGILSKGRTIIAVSGTNGKTTTTAMVAQGWDVGTVTNDTGANMPAGHVAALASSGTHVALEVDEAWLEEVVARTSPAVIVALNLSRDQLDRAGEVRQLAERWRRVLGGAAGVVVANANDPLIVYAAETASRVVWVDVATAWRADAQSCPHCTRALVFEDDSWHCACGFKKPEALAARLNDDAFVGEVRYDLVLGIPGEFNRSNALMALVALGAIGVDLQEAARRIVAITTVAGRYAQRSWRGRHLRLLLAKNPAGFEAMLSVLGPEEHDVLIAINARVADGRDPSWLYDVGFERLRGRRVWCLGERRLDLATRLWYAGVDAEVVDDDAAVLESNATSLVANYTAFSDWIARTSPC